jgi:hypothetical protein
MGTIATTLSGTRIRSPVGISGTVYFTDGGIEILEFNVRSYKPGTLVNSIYPENLTDVAGMSPIFNGTQIALIASKSALPPANPYYLYLYEPFAGTWTSGTPSGGEATYWLPYTCTVSGNDVYIFATFHDGARWNVYCYDCTGGDTMAAWEQITTNDTQIPSGWDVVDINLAGVYNTSGTVCNLYMYLNGAGIGVVSSSILMYTITTDFPYTSGTWTDVTPVYLTSGTADAVQFNINASYPVPDAHVALGVVTAVAAGDDDVFARYLDNTGLLSNNTIILRHVPDTSSWVNTGFVPISQFESISDGHTPVFGEINGRMMYGYSLADDDTDIAVYASSATTSWTNTNFPAGMAVYGIGATTGASGALYLAVEIAFAVTPPALLEGRFSTGGTSTCDITAAVPGDIYNIGGVSNEPTTHIEFTMWDNSAYSSKGKGK